MAGYDPRFIYTSVLDGSLFNLVVWTPDENDLDVVGGEKVGWAGVQAAIYTSHRELWDAVIVRHWETVCSTPFRELEAEFNASRQPNAMRLAYANMSRSDRVNRERRKAAVAGGKGSSELIHARSSVKRLSQFKDHVAQFYMSAESLARLGEQAAAGDVRAFLLHVYHISPTFTGTGLIKSTGGEETLLLADQHNSSGGRQQKQQSIAEHLVRNIRTAGLASTPLGSPSIDEVMMFVVDSFRALRKHAESGQELHTRMLMRRTTSRALAQQSFDFETYEQSKPLPYFPDQVALAGSASRGASKLLGRCSALTQYNAVQVGASTEKRMSPSEYLEYFQTGKCLAEGEVLSGVCGRFVKGKSPQDFEWLAGWAPTSMAHGGMARSMFVTGPQGLQRILEISAAAAAKQTSTTCSGGSDASGAISGGVVEKTKKMRQTSLVLQLLLEIGYEPLFIYEKVNEGYSFEVRQTSMAHI